VRIVDPWAARMRDEVVIRGGTQTRVARMCPIYTSTGTAANWRPPFLSRTVACRGVRRLAARRGWLRHHLHPPAWAVLDVRVVRPRVLAVVPVRLLWGRGLLLDIFRGRLLDHRGRRGIVGVGSSPIPRSPPPRPSPPPIATPNVDPRAPVPPAAAVIPASSAVIPSASAVPRAAAAVRTPASAVPSTGPLRAGPMPPPASCRPRASAPATGTSPRSLGGDCGANQKQPYHHKRPHDLLHGQSPLPCPSGGSGSPIPCGPADGGNRLTRPRLSQSWSRAQPLGQ